VSGPGVIYKFRFKVLEASGETELALGAGTSFYNAGFLLTPVERTGLTLQIGAPVGVPDPGSPGGALQLAPPYPNPARGMAWVRFRLPSADQVRFDLFDTNGRRWVHRPFTRFAAGSHAVPLDPGDTPPGRYVLRLQSLSGAAATAPWVIVR
jgi:hypothetical protein